MEEVVITDYLRTAMSRSRPKEPERDVFNEYRADELLGLALRAMVDRSPFDPKDIGDVITGCAYQVTENWLYGGRAVIFNAGLPEEVPSMAIDRQCASGMSSMHAAAMEIMTGFSDIAIAAGMEHMTHIPMFNEHIVTNPKWFDTQNYPEFAKYDLETGFSMIQTAQKLWEQNETKITREDMDVWSIGSHTKAAKARDEGYFAGEILPVEGTLPDGTKQMITIDQSIREGSTLEQMANLPPVSKGFDRDPQITAGNSSPLNAGAACCVLMSRTKAEELGVKPLARIVSMGWAAVNPGVMGQGPVPASRKALAHAGLSADDIDAWEINEAFAIVPLYAMTELGIQPEKVNIKGGGIALGHALGMTGVRLTCTLARILQETGGRYGLSTPCVGGGQGTATIIERI
jgi:acetyl-CoA C-acetyltransferase